ncbi:MAG: hypothetical protein M3400_11670 [Actinomycetota bacterium]|nr:hypothetical protein [Actinomycetota bacterium]
MILVISYPDNPHVLRVLEHMRREVAVLDLAAFPASAGVEARIGRRPTRLAIRLPDGRLLDLDEVQVVWRRRLRQITPHPDLVDPVSRMFAWSETDEALQGIFHAMSCVWMNSPLSDEVAQRKIRQLQLARHLGLSIPETLVTDDPQLAADFVQARPPNGVIRKAFRTLAEAPRATRQVTAEDLTKIDAVRYAPVIFQDFIPAELDLRVTIVEDEVFAAAIRSEPEFVADYRSGLPSASVTPHELPDDVADGLQRLMKSFDLRYGAIDMRLTPEGEYVFLEVNPAGEYLFISDRTEQPIPQAIAAALERHDRAHNRG